MDPVTSRTALTKERPGNQGAQLERQGGDCGADEDGRACRLLVQEDLAARQPRIAKAVHGLRVVVIETVDEQKCHWTFP